MSTRMPGSRGRALAILATMGIGTAVILLWDLSRSSPAVSEGPLPAAAGARCSSFGSAARHASSIESPDGLLIRVRVPTNYDAKRAYPLLIVYPPAGFDRFAAERYYGVSEIATKQGWIIAYSDARPLSLQTVRAQAKVAETVAAAYCIAPDRIALFGHSDGGALAQGVAELVPDALRPKAIVSSGAGITEQDLADLGCAENVSALIIHSRSDARFPDFGRSALRHWAGCQSCRIPEPNDFPANACSELAGCRGGVRVAYCDVDTPHEVLPHVQESVLAFLNAAVLQQADP